MSASPLRHHPRSWYSSEEDVSTAPEHQAILRSFLHKLSQVVVQARCGGTSSKASKSVTKSQEWEIVHVKDVPNAEELVESKFNLGTPDVAEITDKFETAVGDHHMVAGESFSVQILVKPAGEDWFALEMWTVTVLENQLKTPRLHNDMAKLYRKMATMLKSVYAASRLLPGFRQSFDQSASSFIMFYNLIKNAKDLDVVGSNCQSVVFPCVSCSDVSYRLEIRSRSNYEDRNMKPVTQMYYNTEQYYSSLASLALQGDQSPTTVESRFPQYCSDQCLNCYRCPSDRALHLPEAPPSPLGAPSCHDFDRAAPHARPPHRDPPSRRVSLNCPPHRPPSQE